MVIFQQVVAAFQRGDGLLARQLCAQLVAGGTELPALLWHIDGAAAMALGEPEAAVTSLENAVRRAREDQAPVPETAAVFNDLGLALLSCRRWHQAVVVLRQAAEALPDQPEPASNLGNALRLAGDLAGAAAVLQPLVQRHPGYGPAFVNLGLVARESGDASTACAALQRARALGQEVDAFLARALLSLRRLDEAADLARQAVAKAPHDTEPLVTLGQILMADNRADEALPVFRQAALLEPDRACHLANQSAALFDLGEHQAARAAASAALQLDGDDSGARMNLAAALMVCGDYRQGFPLWEVRWQMPDFRQRYRLPVQPEWDGGSLPAGQTLLVRCEQGFGDVMMMARLFPLLAQRCAPGRLVVEVQAPLLSLIALVPGVAAVVADSADWPEHQAQVALMSLPRVLQLQPATVPPPLRLRLSPAWPLSPARPLSPAWPPSPARPQPRSQALGQPESPDQPASPPSLSIGLAWRSRPAPRDRSIPLSLLMPAVEAGLRDNPAFAGKGHNPALRFLCLHPDGAGDVQAAGAPLELLPPQTTFLSLGQQMASLDLVISVDAAAVHLAALAGVPTWVLLVHGADWRYARPEDGGSPWYPRARLFRQPSPRSWQEPLQALGKALASWQPPRLLPPFRPDSVLPQGSAQDLA